MPRIPENKPGILENKVGIPGDMPRIPQNVLGIPKDIARIPENKPGIQARGEPGPDFCYESEGPRGLRRVSLDLILVTNRRDPGDSAG